MELVFLLVLCMEGGSARICNTRTQQTQQQTHTHTHIYTHTQRENTHTTNTNTHTRTHTHTERIHTQQIPTHTHTHTEHRTHVHMHTSQNIMRLQVAAVPRTAAGSVDQRNDQIRGGDAGRQVCDQPAVRPGALFPGVCVCASEHVSTCILIYLKYLGAQ